MCLVRWVGCVSLVVSPVHLLPRFKRIYLIDLSKSPRRIGSKFLSGFFFLHWHAVNAEMKTKVTNGEGKGELNLCHFLVVGALEPFVDKN